MCAELDVKRINPTSKSEFHYPYFLYIPHNIEENKDPIHLLVEPNNSGEPNIDIEVHINKANNLIRDTFLNQMPDTLKIPKLVPCFPRTQDLYLQQLNRSAVLTEISEFVRLDLQLIAMIKDAKQVLKKLEIEIEDKIFMNGFSASAKFVNRFTTLHPEIVKAAASGGHGGLPLLPIIEYKGDSLRFPIGLSDFNKLFGKDFNLESYKEVAQYLYMGELDTNDAFMFKEVIDPEDTKLILKIWGKDLLLRWESSRTIFDQTGIYKANLQSYPNVDHRYNNEIVNDIIKFFQENMN